MVFYWTVLSSTRTYASGFCLATATLCVVASFFDRNKVQKQLTSADKERYGCTHAAPPNPNTLVARANWRPPSNLPFVRFLLSFFRRGACSRANAERRFSSLLLPSRRMHTCQRRAQSASFAVTLTLFDGGGLLRRRCVRVFLQVRPDMQRLRVHPHHHSSCACIGAEL